MKYLNIQTDFLRSESYLGSEPIERATWLNLMGWCASQENGGVIVGAADWPDRKWQQLCGVTKEEATLVSELYHINDKGELVVNHYPSDKETEVRTKRETARVNGKKGGRPPKNNQEGNPKKPTSVIFAKAEGKGREGKGKERKEGEAREALPNPSTNAAPPQPENLEKSESEKIDDSAGIDSQLTREGQATADELTSQINRLRSSWAMSPHLTAIEMHALSSNLSGLRAITPQGWASLYAYADSPASAEDWTLKTRSRFIENYPEVVTRAHDWEASRKSSTGTADEPPTFGGRKAMNIVKIGAAKPPHPNLRPSAKSADGNLIGS